MLPNLGKMSLDFGSIWRLSTTASAKQLLKLRFKLHFRSLKECGGDLNSKLIWYSDQGALICPMVKWFAFEIPGYSDHHLVNGPVFRPPFYRRTATRRGNIYLKFIYLEKTAIKVYALTLPL